LVAPDYTIKTGQLLLIPPPLSFHLAEQGETLKKVAEKYDLPLGELQQANNLVPDDFLIPAETIVLPGYYAKLQGEIAFLQPTDSRTI
jgi:LysM repeat protein